MITPSVKRGIEFIRTMRFSPDAKVVGVLTNAIIGPRSWGQLFGSDPESEDGVWFEAVGVDSRNGVDLVRTSDGVSYAIVNHAKTSYDSAELSALKAHMSQNPDWYAERQKAAGWI